LKTGNGKKTQILACDSYACTELKYCTILYLKVGKAIFFGKKKAFLAKGRPIEPHGSQKKITVWLKTVFLVKIW